MSNRHLALVRKLDGIKGPPRAVLNVLADHANDNGTSWPSWKTLQNESGFGRSTVHAALRDLKRRGVVSWANRRGESGDLTSNVYTLNVDGGSPPDGLGGVREVDGSSPGGGRRSIKEAPDGSISEASLFPGEILPAPGPTPSKTKQLHELAESIYQDYPRKKNKPDAIKAILKAMKGNDPKMLLAMVKEYAKAITWKELQFIPYPATWFNNECFNDDPKEWENPSGCAGKPVLEPSQTRRGYEERLET